VKGENHTASNWGSKGGVGGVDSYAVPAFAIAAGSCLLALGLIIPSDHRPPTLLYLSALAWLMMNASFGGLRPGNRPYPWTRWARSLRYGLGALLVLLTWGLLSPPYMSHARFGSFIARDLIVLAMVSVFWFIQLIFVPCEGTGKALKADFSKASNISTWDRELDG
jgi:hypothetical protein